MLAVAQAQRQHDGVARRLGAYPASTHSIDPLPVCRSGVGDRAGRITSSGPWDSPGFLLWRSTLRWQRSIAAGLRPLQLTHVQFVLLAAVWWLSGDAERSSPPPSQREVARHAAADVMMTSQVLRALERRGLVTRTHDEADARVKRLTITENGRQLAEQAVIVVEAADADFFARVGDQAQLLDVLHQLAGGPYPAARPGAEEGTGYTRLRDDQPMRR